MLFRLFLKSIALPPTTQILLIGLGFALFKRFPRFAKGCIFLGLLSLYLFAIPLVSQWLYAGLEDIPHLDPNKLESVDAEAIVVLTGWQNETTPEFGRPVSGFGALSRVRYAAFLHQRTQLPVLVSGGNVYGDSSVSLASTMAFDLQSGFGIQAKWLEENSRTTLENAIYSSKILKAAGITRVLLVSNAYHMKRAVLLFESEGMDVVPAPTFFVSQTPISVRSLLPNTFSLNDSAVAMHEWLGYWFYRLTR